MSRGPYFALARDAVRELVAELGGDDAGLLVILATEAATSTGRVRGNLRDLAELVGRSPKHLRLALPRLEERGKVRWRRGRGPGDAGEGWVDVLCYERLDARPRRGRTDPAPRPNRAPTAPLLRPNGHEFSGETTPRQKTADSRPLPTPSYMLTREALAEAAGDQYAQDEATRGAHVRSPRGLARSKTQELLEKHPDRLDGLLRRDALRRAAGLDPVPVSVLRAAALGDCHSLAHYPEPDDAVA